MYITVHTMANPVNLQPLGARSVLPVQHSPFTTPVSRHRAVMRASRVAQNAATAVRSQRDAHVKEMKETAERCDNTMLDIRARLMRVLSYNPREDKPHGGTSITRATDILTLLDELENLPKEWGKVGARPRELRDLRIMRDKHNRTLALLYEYLSQDSRSEVHTTAQAREILERMIKLRKDLRRAKKVKPGDRAGMGRRQLMDEIDKFERKYNDSEAEIRAYEELADDVNPGRLAQLKKYKKLIERIPTLKSSLKTKRSEFDRQTALIAGFTKTIDDNEANPLGPRGWGIWATPQTQEQVDQNVAASSLRSKAQGIAEPLAAKIEAERAELAELEAKQAE